MVYVCFTFVRFIVSMTSMEPSIVPDEIAYKNMAYSYFKYGDFFKLEKLYRDQTGLLPNFLYPYIISTGFYFKNNFFIFIKLINSILINLILFPSYLIMREFVSVKKAFLTSILILFLPFNNFVFHVMPENLYFPLFLLSFFFAYKTLVTSELKYSILTGIFFSLLYLTKPHALVFILTFFFILLFLFIYPAKKLVNAKKRFISVFFVTLTLCMFYVFIEVVLTGNITLSFGFYTNIAKGIVSKSSNLDIHKLIFMVAAHIGSFLFLYLIPFFTAIFSCIYAIKEKNYTTSIFLLFGLCLFFSLFIMTVKFTADIVDYQRLYARYFFFIFPFFLFSFVAFSERISWNNSQKITLILSFCILFVKSVYILLNNFLYRIMYVDNMDTLWVALFPRAVIYFMIIISFLIIMFYVSQKKIISSPYIFFFILFCVFGNIAKIQNEKYIKTAWASNHAVINSIEMYIPDNSNIGIVDSGWFMWRYTMFFLSNYNYKQIFNQFSQNKIITDKMISLDTQWLILYGSYKLDFPVSSEYKIGDYKIVKLR